VRVYDLDHLEEECVCYLCSCTSLIRIEKPLLSRLRWCTSKKNKKRTRTYVNRSIAPPEDAKYVLNEHLALTTNAFWNANQHKFKNSKSMTSSREDQKGNETRVRYFHFAKVGISFD
jgi:hypothetical protein